MPHSRRGVSTLFVVGLVLWALVFGGLYVFKFRGAQTGTAGKQDRERPRPPGTLVLKTGPDGKAEIVPQEDAPESTDGDDARPEVTAWDPEGIADFELTERSGEKVTKQDLLGKPWVVAFVFTRCQGPCPKVSKTMHDLQQATKDLDLRLVTITVDPENDTPDVLSRYAELYNADEDRWLFLTGKTDEIYPLIEGSFKMPVKKVDTPQGDLKYDVIHTTNVLYVDAKGVVRGKYNSLDEADLGKLKALLRKEVPKADEAGEADGAE